MILTYCSIEWQQCLNHHRGLCIDVNYEHTCNSNVPSIIVVKSRLNCRGVVLASRSSLRLPQGQNFVTSALTFALRVLALASKSLSLTTYLLNYGPMGGHKKVSRKLC
jgi:hypothetical protein